MKRKLPDWVSDLGDEALRELLSEVYGAFNADHKVLTAIGSRTALDRVFVLKGASESEDFRGKLAFLKQSGVISAEEEELLKTLTDAGSAAAHRGWKPGEETLIRLMIGLENFLYRTLVQQDDLDAVRKAVPARRERPKKAVS